jgi:hypothetical protein
MLDINWLKMIGNCGAARAKTVGRMCNKYYLVFLPRGFAPRQCHREVVREAIIFWEHFYETWEHGWQTVCVLKAREQWQMIGRYKSKRSLVSENPRLDWCLSIGMRDFPLVLNAFRFEFPLIIRKKTGKINAERVRSQWIQKIEYP